METGMPANLLKTSNRASISLPSCPRQMMVLALFFFTVLLGLAVAAINGQWFPGHATFYGAGQDPTSLGGACGYDNTFHAGFGVNTAALSGALFGQGRACGLCFEVICDAGADPQWCLQRATVTVTATNFCPPNNRGGWCDPPHSHFDMSLPAFARIARVGSEGVVPILYRRVACTRSGGVQFTLKGQGNFNLVMFSNVGGSGDVKAAWIKGSRGGSTWRAMQRNWGANWQSNADYRSQGLSFRLLLGDGKMQEFAGVVPSSWRPGETFVSQGQFS